MHKLEYHLYMARKGKLITNPRVWLPRDVLGSEVKVCVSRVWVFFRILDSCGPNSQIQAALRFF